MVTHCPMMTHDELLKSLPPELRADMMRKSDLAGLRHLALHLGAIVITGTWITLGWPLWEVLLPVHGLLLVFLFTLQHECTHQTPFANRALCEAVGHATGFVILQPFQWFRLFHLAHHRHTNDPQNDPELLSGAKPATLRAYLWHLSGLPVWIWLIRQVFENAFGTPQAAYLPDRAMPRLRREARIMLAGYALVLLLFPKFAFWLWLLPMILAQPVLRLYLLAEHGRCPPVANMLENTRTTLTTRLVRFLAWNMPYHIEHHSAPNVPFHQLPTLHKYMKDHLFSTAPGYVAFTRDYVSGLDG